MKDALLASLLTQMSPILIATLVPVLVAQIKTWFDGLPKVWLPMLPALIAGFGDLAITWTTGWNLVEGGPLMAAFAGLAGTGVREVVDQLKKQYRQVTG